MAGFIHCAATPKQHLGAFRTVFPDSCFMTSGGSCASLLASQCTSRSDPDFFKRWSSGGIHDLSTPVLTELLPGLINPYISEIELRTVMVWCPGVRLTELVQLLVLRCVVGGHCCRSRLKSDDNDECPELPSRDFFFRSLQIKRALC